MMTTRILHLALFSLLCSAVAPLSADDGNTASKIGDREKKTYKLPEKSQDIQNQYGQPDWTALIKNIIAFGGPLAVMIIANRKLKKDKEARQIKLKEQQGAQGGNPMAQLMMMMQQQGMGGAFPGAEVRQPAVAQKKIAPEDMIEGKKPYERHILSKGMRRFWNVMSWLCSGLALVNGLGLGFNTYALFSEKNVPGAMHNGQNLRQGAYEVVDRFKPTNAPDSLQTTDIKTTMNEDSFIQKIRPIISLDPRPIIGTDLERVSTDYKRKADQACDNIHINAHNHLQNNWLAKTTRTVFGHDILTRFIMLFKDFTKTPV